MRLASWNVNSIRQRLAHVLDWLNAHEPDVLALQEIKTDAAGFPLADIEAAGYRCVLDGQKAFNRVALLSREEPVDVATGIPADSTDNRPFS
jgi:exodeoxyribonuclease-3